ncbi:TPA: hypothetical protein ACH3X1_015380 [Trebouxia sp. C0004]
MAASSPGRGVDLRPQACDEASDITYLTVGFWRRSAKPAPLSFFVLHSSEKFVLLAEEPWCGQQAHSRRLFKIVKQLNAKSPFRTSSCRAGNYLVVSFEINWEDVCGFNYHNPLCQPGRVVIEAAHVTKRQFLTMKEAQKYYLKRVSTPEPLSSAVSRRAGAHTLRTYASSPNMSLPLVARAELTRAQSKAHAQHKHIQWQADSNWQLQPAPAQSAAMRNLEQALPSMPETSAASQTPAPAAMQEQTARTDDCHATKAHHQPRHGDIGAKTCLKHTGVGGMSPPQAREPETAAAAAAADQSSSQMPSASFQANSTLSADQPRQSQNAPASEAAAEFVSAFSGASQLQAEDELGRQSGSSEQGIQDEWPDTCTWTVPCHVYKYRTVTFNFEDPSLPGVLQPAINNNERLLKLYESGLPVWAIFLPTYGLYYRPWMRRLTWILFIAVSVFSMACGFYDLYKNVPHVDKVLRKVLGSFFLPSTAIFHWLEDHAQIRLSILLTYLFGESILFVHLLTWLDYAWNVAGRPIVELMGPPLVVLGSGLEQWGRQFLLLGRSCATAASLAFKTVMGPPMVLLIAGMQAVAQFMLPIWQVMVVVVTGPVSLLYAALRSMQAASSTVWQGARPLGHAARSAATLVRTSSLAATGSGASMADMGQQMGGWWWRWMPGEAWELLRISSLKTLRALQTLGKLATQLASDVSKHRLTLSRRMCRTWRRCKRWFYGVIMAIASLPAAVYCWFVSFGAVLHHVPKRLSSSPDAETATNVLVDATDRPVLTGMMAIDNHSKVE